MVSRQLQAFLERIERVVAAYRVLLPVECVDSHIQCMLCGACVVSHRAGSAWVLDLMHWHGRVEEIGAKLDAQVAKVRVGSHQYFENVTGPAE